MSLSGPTGDTQSSVKPTETRNRFVSILSSTTPVSTKALTLTERSFHSPGNGVSSSALPTTLREPPRGSPLASLGPIVKDLKPCTELGPPAKKFLKKGKGLSS